MKYLLFSLVNDLTFPLLFFWFSLPFVMLLIVVIIWLQLLLNEAQVLSAEEITNQYFGEPDSDFKFEYEPIEEENQNDSSSTEMQEETQSSGTVGKPRPKPAYLNSNPKSQKQAPFSVISDSWSQSQEIKYSLVEKSDFCSIMMLLCTMLSSLTWNFVCQLLQISRIQLLPPSLIIYMAQLFVLLCEKVVKILDSLRLESRGQLALVLRRKLEQCDEAREPPQSRNKAGSPVTISSNPAQHQ